jgi:hypothetical protein
VPPNLDIPRASTPPAWNSRFLELLERLAGPACLLDPEGNIAAAGTSWDDFASRSGRTDLTREQITGRMFGNLLPEGEQRFAFEVGLAAIAEGAQDSFTLSADFGSGGKLLTLNLHVQAIREDDRLAGYLVQGTDVSAEHLSRLALLDRERKLRELRSAYQRQADEVASLQNQLEAVGERRDDAVTALLVAFENEHENFASAFCRLAAEAGNALFAVLSVYAPETQRLRFAAEHNAPDYPRLMLESGLPEPAMGEGPAGMAAQKRCGTPFNHLLSRQDLSAWWPLAKHYGGNCVWAFPIEDGGGLYGVLELYYAAEEAALPLEPYAVLTTLCQLAAPLLRAGDAWKVSAALPEAAHKPANFRLLAAGLAEEFANLLTGVLGHSSLIAAEMGEGHGALEDIRAIEKAARGAARLTRRLTALCGSVHHGPAPLDAAAFLRSYVTRDRADYFAAGPAALQLPEGRFQIPVEGPTLEVILDGMAEHARTVGRGAPPVWSLQAQDEMVRLTLTYDGTPSLPPEWSGETWTAHSRSQVSELLFAREAARAAGGEITVEEQAEHTDLIFTIPLVPEPAPREQT